MTSMSFLIFVSDGNRVNNEWALHHEETAGHPFLIVLDSVDIDVRLRCPACQGGVPSRTKMPIQDKNPAEAHHTKTHLTIVVRTEYASSLMYSEKR
jgi:hypothetical protein